MKYTLLITCLLAHYLACSQKYMAITIDDVPNTVRFEKDGYRSLLLHELDSLGIPIAIFINEGLVYRTDSISKNFELLHDWAHREYMTLGNHTFDHSRYSTTGIAAFSKDVLRGASISNELAKKYNKKLRFFRFPFNDLGKDSLQHKQVRQFLNEQEYSIAPFTIESSDWMYSVVYEYYLDRGNRERAQEIGLEYVTKTLEYVTFFETLAQEDYGRDVHQIYLCHDSKLNTDFLPVLIERLRALGYSFLTLEEAMTDPIYQQKDNYYKKWGISWLYRWKTDHKERIKKMKQEPSTEAIMKLYEQVLKEESPETENSNK